MVERLAAIKDRWACDAHSLSGEVELKMGSNATTPFVSMSLSLRGPYRESASIDVSFDLDSAEDIARHLMHMAALARSRHHGRAPR